MVDRRRPFALSVHSEVNDRLDCMFPDSAANVNGLDAFSPLETGDNESSNLKDEEARGPITSFTPEMADNEDGLETVDGFNLTPAEAPWDPHSAFGGSAGDPGIPAEADGFDETKLPDRYARTRQPLPNSPAVQAAIENVRQGFPDRPRPDLRIIRSNDPAPTDS